MPRSAWILLFLLVLSPLAAPARQKEVAQPLTPTQELGQRIYEQRCGVCHTVASPGFPMYGPALYKGLVAGNEDAIRAMIREGSAKMPGFKFGLQPSEIDAIIEYLKTVPKPEKTNAPVNVPQGPVD
ncbi:MAG: c-type cytochrome [Candidatus Acidiferrales bacterium]